MLGDNARAFIHMQNSCMCEIDLAVREPSSLSEGIKPATVLITEEAFHWNQKVLAWFMLDAVYLYLDKPQT